MKLLAKAEILGLIQYRRAVEYMYGISKEVRDGGVSRVLLCQHYPVYTLGRRQSEVLKCPEGAETVHTARGGLSTFHGPGQLLCYPILNLLQLRKGKYIGGVRWYVHCLEQAVIETCKEFGVVAERCEHVGVWTGGEKICSIGVHIQRGVTTHGLALNCTTDLSWFDAIEPCGVSGKKMTSLSKASGKVVRVKEVTGVLVGVLADVLGLELC